MGDLRGIDWRIRWSCPSFSQRKDRQAQEARLARFTLPATHRKGGPEGENGVLSFRRQIKSEQTQESALLLLKIWPDKYWALSNHLCSSSFLEEEEIRE